MNEYCVKCECQGEILLLTNNQEEDQVNLALYSHGQYQSKPNLWQRLKYAWYHLRTGAIYTDALIISHEQAEQLGEWLMNVRLCSAERSGACSPKDHPNKTEQQ